MQELVPSGYALLVTGSLNAMEEDREHDGRSWLRPVQVVLDGAVAPCSFFNAWGELGVSAFAFIHGDPTVLYVTTGADLIELHVRIREAKVLSMVNIDIPQLKDVHEMSLIDGVLWLANTGYDEAVAFDITRKEIVNRISLASFRKFSNAALESLRAGVDGGEIDRFHCNQVFRGLDGRLYALVHHVSGKQLLARIANKFIKRQGNGGVMDIETGRKIALSLKGPHSVRCVGNEYWICDSGSRTVNVYDADWTLKKKLDSVGWGRGADFSITDNMYYVGSSAQRKRYRNRPDFNDKNVVQVFGVSGKALKGEILIPDGIEQINNLYLIPRTLGEAMMRLSESSAITA